ncbi:MAG: hypothetical protein K0R63_586 [Rickettsiales bacterium]|jgi:hypothetical protein|nr:hypothetical protein [Rickettsiales bacterium]
MMEQKSCIFKNRTAAYVKVREARKRKNADLQPIRGMSSSMHHTANYYR